MRLSCAERASTAARRFRVRVVEDESLAEKLGVVVERGPVQKKMALLVDEDLRALRPLEHLVAEARLALPGEGVAETRAAAALHAHTKAAFADALLGHQRPDFLRGSLGYLNHCLQVRPEGGLHRVLSLRLPIPAPGSRVPAGIRPYALGCACSATAFTPFASSCFFL